MSDLEQSIYIRSLREVLAKIEIVNAWKQKVSEAMSELDNAVQAVQDEVTALVDATMVLLSGQNPDVHGAVQKLFEIKTALHDNTQKMKDAVAGQQPLVKPAESTPTAESDALAESEGQGRRRSH
jgi:uncharacterized protein YoxC